jgi:hypothetical protein
VTGWQAFEKYRMLTMDEASWATMNLYDQIQDDRQKREFVRLLVEGHVRFVRRTDELLSERIGRAT